MEKRKIRDSPKILITDFAVAAYVPPQSSPLPRKLLCLDSLLLIRNNHFASKL